MADVRRRTAGEMGEFALVNAITARFTQGAHVQVGPGDDAAVVDVPTGAVVASVDMLLQDRHFRLDWSTASDIGHKAAAESLSDINAMGGGPRRSWLGSAVRPRSSPAGCSTWPTASPRRRPSSARRSWGET